MKKLAAMLGICAMTAGAFAQGTIQFFPTPSTTSSINNGGTVSATSGAPGSYYYALLTNSSPSGTFAFTGNYATNLQASGYFGGLAAQTVPGWAPGTSMSFKVAMWSSSLGATFNPNWLNNQFGTGSGYFGISVVGTGTSGGLGTPATPALQLFGASPLINQGIVGQQVGGVAPEPGSMALAGLGAAALLIFRRRK